MCKIIKLLSVFIFSAFMLNISEAHAFGLFGGSTPRVSGSVGVFVPSGYLSGKTNAGVTASVTVAQSVVPSLVDFRLTGSYSNASGSSGGTNYTFNSYGLQGLVVLAPNTPTIKPYIGAGYGLYYNTLGRNGNKTNDKSEFGHGPLIRGGVDFAFTVVRVGISAQYQSNISSGKDYGGWSVGANAGFSF